MEKRKIQLQQAKQRQRERDRSAGLVLYQAKLPRDLARRLKAGMKNPGFRMLFDEFLETELIDLADFPQLRQLCWNLKTEFLTRNDAFALYERNWRFIDQSELTATERTLIDQLKDQLGSGENGYRELRNHVSNRSLGGIFSEPPTLLRDIRADMYGIRTFVEVDGEPVKFEIIREARINLTGAQVADLPVACLNHSSAVAEKFLANTDRGLDKSTRSRDLVDLAFMAASWSKDDVSQGLEMAETAYGDVVLELLKSALKLFGDGSYRKQCVTELEIGQKQKLEMGLGLLAEIVRS